MNYPKWNLTTAILLLLGLHPFTDQSQDKWVQKVHLLGLFFCANQVVLTCYTFSLEQTRVAYYSNNANNIMHGAVVTKKMCALGIPLVSVLFKFINMRPLEMFSGKMCLLDEFLQSLRLEVGFECLKQETLHKTRRLNFLSGIAIIAIELLNIAIAFCYSALARGAGIPPWYTVYFYHSFISMHLSIALNIYTHFYALTLRQDLFTAYVQRVADLQGSRKIRERRRQRVNKDCGGERRRLERAGVHIV